MGLEQLAIAFGLTVVKALIDAGRIRPDQTVAEALADLSSAEADAADAAAGWRRALPPDRPANG